MNRYILIRRLRGPAILLLIMEVLTSERRIRWLARWTVLKKEEETTT